jgi:signal transduction histidine kinase
MHDSLRVNMNARQVGELQIKYESSEKDIEIARISHAKRIENKQVLIISAITFLFIFFFIILFLQYRLIWHNNRNIKQSNEKKDKALVDIAYIQSHELRKPLASILGLINVIRSSDGIVDQESLDKLEEAGKDLDQKIHDIISNIDQAE